MRKQIILGALVAVVVFGGCSKKELIAQKDREIEDLRAQVAQAEADLAAQRQMNSELQDALSDFKNKEQVWIQERENLTTITLDGSATFGTASAELTKDARNVIDSVWDVVQNYPDRWVLIEGHADSRPLQPKMREKFSSNWDLSSARALAVLHYLLGKNNVNPDRIRAVGCGVYDPAADNATPEGMAKNRRVVFTIGTKRDMQRNSVLP